MQINKRLVVVPLFLLLSACSVFPPLKTQSESVYVINSVPRPPVRHSDRHYNILVMPVYAGLTYDTTQMAYTMHPYQINYFVLNFWAETPAQMLRPLIVQTLQRTHYFHAVSGFSYLGSYDYILDTQLLQLTQDFSGFGSSVHLRIQAQIINAESNEVVASKEFYAVERAPEPTPYGGVVATNRAVARILKSLAAFCEQMI